MLNNAVHMKEILVHLKPNNFPRYIDQLSDLEGKINAIDATKFNHNVTTARSEDVSEPFPDVSEPLPDVSEPLPDAPITPVSVDLKKTDAKKEESEENSVEDKLDATTSQKEMSDGNSNEQSNKINSNEEPKEITADEKENSKEESQDPSLEPISQKEERSKSSEDA